MAVRSEAISRMPAATRRTLWLLPRLRGPTVRRTARGAGCGPSGRVRRRVSASMPGPNGRAPRRPARDSCRSTEQPYRNRMSTAPECQPHIPADTPSRRTLASKTAKYRRFLRKSPKGGGLRGEEGLEVAGQVVGSFDVCVDVVVCHRVVVLHRG